MSDDAKNELDFVRIGSLLAALILSVIFGFIFGDTFRNSESAAGHIGVIFSILAASLFAVISIVGDPSMLLTGNRRVARVSAKGLQRRIQRYNLLFVLYVTTLGVMLLSELIKTEGYERFYFIFNVLAFLTSFCFLCSLTVGYGLSKLQRDRMEQEIKNQ